MKIRNGFVSNSSSSSFIIALKNPDKVKIMGYSLVQLGVTDICANKKELKEYYKDELYLEDIEEISKMHNSKAKEYKRDIENYNMALKEIKKGKMVCFGYCADDSCNVIQRGLVGGGWGDLEFDEKQEMKVIRDCNGY